MPSATQRDAQDGHFMRNYPTCDLYILTGERSGEAYAAAVLRHLQQLRPDLRCLAMGGEELSQAGAEIEFSSDGYDVVGFIPIALQLRKFLARRRDLVAAIKRHQPKVVLSIDYPGMNMDVQERLSELGACTRIHVVAPQVWAWRPWRAKKYAHACDRLACFFPFEPAYFTPFGCQADFIGHPMVDMIAAEPLHQLSAEAQAVDLKKPLLLLAPGSRSTEVALLLPIFDAAARSLQRLLAARGEEISVAIARSDRLPDAAYAAHSQFPRVTNNYRQLCSVAHVAAISSGTATLEAALIGLPHVACYKTDAATARLAKHLINTAHIALPNIVHGERVIPELLQNELTVERLCLHLLGLWQGSRRERCLKTLGKTTEKLGGRGAMAKLARLVDEEIGHNQGPNRSPENP